MKLNDLCMSYGQKTLFENLSFHLNQGLILIKGKSGCGKSTLLKILMEKEKPTSGNLEILDSEKDYLYLGEGTFLLDYLSLKKNISFLLKEKITKETEDKAKKLYVYTLLDTPISKLSSGERQKMELLFALQSRHHTYYFDEPFSSMDKESKKVALELIQEKARDTLCFLIAHEDIECDYDLKILFQDGKVSVDTKRTESRPFDFHNEKRNSFALSLSYLLHKEKDNLIFQLFLLCTFLFTFFFGLSNLDLLSLKDKKETMISSYPFAFYQMRTTKEDIDDSFFDIEKDCIIQYYAESSDLRYQFTFLSCLPEEEKPIYVSQSKSFLSEGENILINSVSYDVNIVSPLTDEIKEKLPDSYHYRLVKDGKETEDNLILCSKSFLNLVLSNPISFSMHPEVETTLKTFSVNGNSIAMIKNDNFVVNIENPKRLSVPGHGKGEKIIGDRDFNGNPTLCMETTQDNSNDTLYIGIDLYKRYLFYFYSKEESKRSPAVFTYILSKEQISKTIYDDAFSIADVDRLYSDDKLAIILLSISLASLVFLVLFPFFSQKGLETYQFRLHSLLTSHNRKSCFTSYFFFYFISITLVLALFYLLRSTLFLRLGNYNFMINQYGDMKQEGYYYYSKQPANDYFDSMLQPIRWQRMNRYDFLPLLAYLLPGIYAYFFSKKPKKKKKSKTEETILLKRTYPSVSFFAKIIERKADNMHYTYQDYMDMVQAIRQKTDFKPLIGATLGSGLDGLLDDVDIIATIPYKNIPGMKTSTNGSHKGQFVFGLLHHIPCVFMQGRLHFYEGYTSEECTVPIRLMGLLGIQYLLLTNAAGGMGKDFHPGDLMVIEDHISTFVPSPLRGENIEEFGTRFPDMSDVYDEKLTKEIYQKGMEMSLPMKKGVYLQFPGPQFETKAEIQMAIQMGASAAGMSTAIEAIVSNHMSIKTVGVSLITNYAAGISKEKLSDEDVIKTAEKSGDDFKRLFVEIINILRKDYDDR